MNIFNLHFVATIAHVDTILDYAQPTDSSVIDEDVFEYFPEHQFCFAHTLQLAVNDGMKDIGSLQKVVTKASNIVSYIKKSYYVSEFLENFKSVSI